MSDGRPRRVLVVDDQRSFADSLALVIDSVEDLTCIGTAASGEEAVERCAVDAPDVVLMDVDMPGIDGVEATRRIADANPDVHVVVLTGAADAGTLGRAAGAGARAFLLKDSALAEILDSVRSVGGRGAMGVDDDVTARLLGSEQDGPGPQLTYRELEVLAMLAQGRQPKEVAHHLGISLHTCRGYVKNILATLNCHSALEAVVEAHRRGIIHLPTE
ncbi:MAG: response regulator transcription factor [Acidimicrobiia bacterium]